MHYPLMRSLFLSFALVSCALAVPTQAGQRQAAQPVRFDAIAFFTGNTRGAGRLKVVMRPAHAIDVRGYGRVERDGTLVLSQTVEEHGKDPRRRQWRMREVSPGRYAGTLTDAVGPVTGTSVGNRLTLSYRMKGGLSARQVLELAPDGQSARNMMRVKRLGVTVAELDETIRRIGL